ncbi:amino-acid N-acetyltransferase [Pelomicrobium methylotrophicum]|uniref:Amino-acid acetyltransferase n=1 Tax=Pelomicrobium methylotrophicum TaxID=2602750 RepID=A0A5C7ENS2_9PROT|nr:amino-acid N-acetyltransferase [Pelomicrobium methylotrophicum]TXF13411.1 amino-acid N-acetyltransferase [Pelomicrobium methylotrophicum]
MKPVALPPSRPVPEFVHWFRSVAPYVNAFRGRTFVVAFGGEVVADGKFIELTHDFNLLASLGIRLVLVHGARPQIEARMKERGAVDRYVRGLRVTDELALQCVKEAVGRMRVEIEALLSTGLPNSPMANAQIRVASGNFVIAKPVGVIDGVDLLHTGQVRRVDAEAISARLDRGEVVLLSPLGFSPTGEVFNLAMEDVATATAIALRAEKLIFLGDAPGVQVDGELLRELTAGDAEALLKKPGRIVGEVRDHLEDAVRACREGVGRAHLISRHVDGAILLELFTHEGIGTMVTAGSIEALRGATIDDIGGVLKLIEPLEAEGVLVKRGRELLEREIDRFVVAEHDAMIVGCAALYPFPEDKAGELACLAVHPDYQNRGYGDALLKMVETRARRAGLKQLFVLTTRTAHWFLERGFVEKDVNALPRRRQALYNLQRRSKVFAKRL